MDVPYWVPVMEKEKIDILTRLLARATVVSLGYTVTYNSLYPIWQIDVRSKRASCMFMRAADEMNRMPKLGSWRCLMCVPYSKHEDTTIHRLNRSSLHSF